MNAAIVSDRRTFVGYVARGQKARPALPRILAYISNLLGDREWLPAEWAMMNSGASSIVREKAGRETDEIRQTQSIHGTVDVLNR